MRLFKGKLGFTFFMLLLLVSVPQAKGEDGSGDNSVNVLDIIGEHMEDSHKWHFYGYGEGSVSLPLPVIIYVDGGFVAFMSSRFHHDQEGKVFIHKGGHTFTRYDNEIYEVIDEDQLTLDQKDSAIPLLGTYKGVLVYDFSIKKNVFGIFLASLLLFIVIRGVARGYKDNFLPKGIFSKLFEPIILHIRDRIGRDLIGEGYFRRYVPYLLTLFFFIWFSNMLGLLPIGPNIMGNIVVTFFLAMVTLLITLFSARKRYWEHVFWMPGVPKPVRIFLAPIEILGIFTKPLALMIRLFANISAGHIMILGLLSVIFIFGWWGTPSVLLASLLLGLEFVVAFVQAYIFTFLTALFIGFAVEGDH